MKYKIALICIFICAISRTEAQSPANAADLNFPYKSMPEVLQGTKPFILEGDLSAKMLGGAHKFLDEKIDESIVNRSKLWNRNFSSQEAYQLSVEPNRRRFIKYIGVEDKNENNTN